MSVTVNKTNQTREGLNRPRQTEQMIKSPKDNEQRPQQQPETKKEEQPKNVEEIKQFSDKTLDELADYYLKLEPADIPDTGFVVSGIAGRFPSADNLNELWDNLVNGRDMVVGPDDKRWPLGK